MYLDKWCFRMPSNMLKIGWLYSAKFLEKKWGILTPFGFYKNFELITPSTRMRVGNISRWINQNSRNVECELYNPWKKYNLVVVVKISSPKVIALVSKLQKSGCKVIYDANVNYWEVWGKYSQASPKPTPEQQENTILISNIADLIVADSTYLANIASKYNKNVTWIPDNVDQILYCKKKKYKKQPEKLNLIWSGMSHKAEHLLDIRNTLEKLKDKVLITIVSEQPPPVLVELKKTLDVQYFRFSDKDYAAHLAESDVIISPKRLQNAYDLGHTEYKITLGMSVGLPAIASAQQSYIEAISYKQGGFIARSEREWESAIEYLFSDYNGRVKIGQHAYETVEELYSTPVVAKKYLCAIRELV